MELCVVFLFIPVIEFSTCIGNGNYALVVTNGLVETCTKDCWKKEKNNVSRWGANEKWFLYSRVQFSYSKEVV
jgi:hypothetical protein